MRGSSERYRRWYRVQRVGRGSVVIDGLEDVQPGDGVVFDTGADQDAEPGGSVLRAAPAAAAAAGAVELTVRGLNLAAVRPGQLCWRTKREGALSQARGTYDRARAVEKRRVRVDAALAGRLGGPITLTLRVRSSSPRTSARNCCPNMHMDPALQSHVDPALQSPACTT